MEERIVNCEACGKSYDENKEFMIERRRKNPLWANGRPKKRICNGCGFARLSKAVLNVGHDEGDEPNTISEESSLEQFASDLQALSDSEKCRDMIDRAWRDHIK